MSNQIFWKLGSYVYPFYGGVLNSFLQRYTKNASLVLDAGCGKRGGYLKSLASTVNGVCLDISKRNIKLSKQKLKGKSHNHSFVVADLEKTPFKKNVFNIVVCCDVLEHIKHPEEAIKQMCESLRKGGKLLISTTNKFNPAMLMDTIFPKNVSAIILAKFADPHYERSKRFNPFSFVRMLNDLHLKLDNLSMLGFPPLGRPWICHFKGSKPSLFHRFWIVFDKLTKIGFLKNFKEEMVVVANK